MHTLDIKVGERFIIQERLWIYSHRANQNSDLCFVDEAGNPKRKTEQELMEMFSSRDARHDPNYIGGRTRKTERLLQDLASFDPEHLAIAFDREIYVKAIIAAGIPRPQRKTWPSVINDVPLPRSFSKAPSWHTVSDWVRSYRAAGKDVRAIVPAFCQRGRKPAERSQEEQRFVGAFVNDWLRRERPTTNGLFNDLNTAYKAEKQKSAHATTWKCPSKSSVYNMVKGMDAWTVLSARYDEAGARKKLQFVGSGPIVKERLERTEMDHTTLNLMVVDDKGILLGRPTFTVGLDCHTGMPLGHYIGFAAPGPHAVTQCIRDMLSFKTYVQAEYGINRQWRGRGIGLQNIVDNAGEFTSDSFIELAANLKCDILLQPVKRPWWKGRVERFMRTLATSRICKLPGATFSNVVEKGSYDPSKMACVTLRELRRAFLQWLLNDYIYGWHDGLMGVPAQLWDEAVARLPIPLMDLDEIDKSLGTLHDATLNAKGIRYEYLYYQSEELQELLYRHGEGQTIEFRVNPEALGKIVVIHPQTGQHFDAFCTVYEYASQTTLDQHLALRAWRRQKGKAYLEAEAELISDRMAMIEEFRELQAKGGKNPNRSSRMKGGENVQQPNDKKPKGFKNPMDMSLGEILKRGSQFPQAEPPRSKMPGGHEDEEEFERAPVSKLNSERI